MKRVRLCSLQFFPPSFSSSARGHTVRVRAPTHTHTHTQYTDTYTIEAMLRDRRDIAPSSTRQLVRHWTGVLGSTPSPVSRLPASRGGNGALEDGQPPSPSPRVNDAPEVYDFPENRNSASRSPVHHGSPYAVAERDAEGRQLSHVYAKLMSLQAENAVLRDQLAGLGDVPPSATTVTLSRLREELRAVKLERDAAQAALLQEKEKSMFLEHRLTSAEKELATVREAESRRAADDREAQLKPERAREPPRAAQGPSQSKRRQESQPQRRSVTQPPMRSPPRNPQSRRSASRHSALPSRPSAQAAPHERVSGSRCRRRVSPLAAHLHSDTYNQTQPTSRFPGAEVAGTRGTSHNAYAPVVAATRGSAQLPSAPRRPTPRSTPSRSLFREDDEVEQASPAAHAAVLEETQLGASVVHEVSERSGPATLRDAVRRDMHTRAVVPSVQKSQREDHGGSTAVAAGLPHLRRPETAIPAASSGINDFSFASPSPRGYRPSIHVTRNEETLLSEGGRRQLEATSSLNAPVPANQERGHFVDPSSVSWSGTAAGQVEADGSTAVGAADWSGLGVDVSELRRLIERSRRLRQNVERQRTDATVADLL